MKNLNSPGAAKVTAERIKQDIDKYAVRAYYEPHRWHLGASLIGHECSRYLWYTFRWCMSEPADGRKLRLFNRGHREEDRFIEFLKGIGATLWTHDESQPKKADGTYPQFRMSAVGGHFGGSLDGILKLPDSYEVEQPLLAEFKTNGTGKHFTDVSDKGMAVAKPQHWAQTCSYGNFYKLEYLAYFIVNKNDDDLTIEVVKLDWKLGEQMIAKAERIITSQTPPPRLAENPTYFKCVYCAAKHVCHNGAKPEFNCRSCINCIPIDNAEFHCSHHNGTIPKDFVKQGCPAYKAIVNG